jgi:hypothetical protein
MDHRLFNAVSGSAQQDASEAACRLAPRRAIWPLLIVMAVALAVLVAPAQASNLVVKDVTLKSSPSESSSTRFPSVVIERDRHGQFGVVFRIKNIGKTTAHNIDANVFIGSTKIDTQHVRRIAAGASETVRESYNRSFEGPGFYHVSVCVSRHNCSKHVDFPAVPRRWEVTHFSTGPNSFGGTAPFTAARSGAMNFDFYGTVNDNGDEYFVWLATGGITGDVSGQYDGCRFSGHGAVSHSPWDMVGNDIGYLEINTSLDGYFAEVEDQSHSYTGTTACTGYPPFSSESGIDILNTISLDGRVDQPMASDAQVLAGHYKIPTGFGGAVVGSWLFSADVP